MNDNFPCTKCGLCCRNLNKSNIYDDLNSGDGTCIYLDTNTNLCTIYNTRPLKCNIIASYTFFKDTMSLKDYIKLNVKACNKLKKEMS